MDCLTGECLLTLDPSAECQDEKLDFNKKRWPHRLQEVVSRS